MTVDELLNKLACDLPAGAEVAFYVENGAGWVEAHDWDGNPWEGGDNIELSIEQRALDALEWCQAQDAANAKIEGRD